MTAIGINATDRDPVNGWEAVQPNGRRKNRELVEAEMDENIAWDRYEMAVDNYYDWHHGDKEYLDKVNELKTKAEAASLHKMEIYNRINGITETPHEISIPDPEQEW